MASRYYCILLDLDGTLLDFAAAERAAISSVMEGFGLPSEEAVCSLFTELNAQLWAQLERGQVKKDKLGVTRFTQLLERLSLQGDPVRLNSEYAARLASFAMPFPGARELLEDLAEYATLAAITNGNPAIQKSRLEKSGLAPYFDEIFVSENTGAMKPQAHFFEYALRQLGIKNKQKVLVVGDSLTADIQGGINAGLDTCWCNFTQAEPSRTVMPTYTVRNYEQLKVVAVGEEELKRAAIREKRHMV